MGCDSVDIPNRTDGPDWRTRARTICVLCGCVSDSGQRRRPEWHRGWQKACVCDATAHYTKLHQQHRHRRSHKKTDTNYLLVQGFHRRRRRCHRSHIVHTHTHIHRLVDGRWSSMRRLSEPINISHLMHLLRRVLCIRAIRPHISTTNTAHTEHRTQYRHRRRRFHCGRRYLFRKHFQLVNNVAPISRTW